MLNCITLQLIRLVTEDILRRYVVSNSNSGLEVLYAGAIQGSDERKKRPSYRGLALLEATWDIDIGGDVAHDVRVIYNEG